MSSMDKTQEAAHTPGPDWYERRHELEPGMVFQSTDGIVRLEQRTEGDGSRWDVSDWWGGAWACMGCEIEPGDLRGEPIEDSPDAIAKAMGAAAPTAPSLALTAFIQDVEAAKTHTQNAMLLIDLGAAASYIDALGGDSKCFRATIARATGSAA